MKNKWVLFVASRYIFKGRSSSPILAVLGIATGVLALIVIIAVMNGFQLGFIESILEVSSYHIRAELKADPEGEASRVLFETGIMESFKENVLSVPGVLAVIPFKEYQAIARGSRSGQMAVLVRGLNEDALELDNAMAARLYFEEGRFDLKDADSIILGRELARRLGVNIQDKITLFSITGLLVQEEDEGLKNFTVTGIFRTDYYEYDSSWAIININDGSFAVNESDTILGIKISNRFQDKAVLEKINKSLPDIFKGVKLSSWRDYNRAFFGALRTEKLFMFILVGLIFIVVGLNIYQAQRRAVMQRREEIGLLRAIGGADLNVRSVFVLDGAIIGFTGASIGLVLGLGIALNIQGFFNGVEIIVNGVIRFLNLILSFFGFFWIDNFSVFSPAVFYLKEIPVRILPLEVVIIFSFGFLSALAAAWFASGKIAKYQPAEVLRYE